MTGGRMSSNWIEAEMSVVIEFRTLSHKAKASKKCEDNGLENGPENMTMTKDLAVTGAHRE